MSNRYKWTVALAAAVFSSWGQAQTPQSANLTTQLEVLRSCSLEKIQDMDFGLLYQGTDTNYSNNGAATGIAKVVCGRETPYSIRLQSGLHPNAGVRRMKHVLAGSCSPGNCIPYRVYRNAARTAIWNLGERFNQAAITAPDHARLHSFYGQLDNSLDYRPGVYRDTVVILVAY